MAYLSVLVSPGIFWPASFVALTIPFCLFFHAAALGYFLWKKPKYAILPFTALALGYPFIRATLALNKAEPAKGRTLKVLSYNVRVFNVYDHLYPGPDAVQNMIDWIARDDADIKCLQEYYTKPGGHFNTLQQIGAARGYSHQFHSVVKNRKGAEFGLIIFSKHKIINTGHLAFPGSTTNKAVFADVVVQTDTIRVINLHFQSLGLAEEDFDVNRDNVKKKSTNLVKVLKEGFMNRNQQIRMVQKLLGNTPQGYRVVLCGDFNDTPYSYSYFFFRRKLKNAFEEGGKGFGFTYNGFLYLLRIDYIFVDPRLQVLSFQTYRNVGYTDHYPVKAVVGLGD